MWSLALCFLAAFMTVWLTNWVYKWRNPRCNGELPPGSMGIPVLGETLQFLKSHSSLDIHPFFRDRMKRYGSLFKTSLFGYPLIVSTDPEFSHFIFQQDGDSVEMWFMGAAMELIGKQKLSVSTGTVHKYLRNMVFDLFGPAKQKEKLLLELVEMARRNLDIWCKQDSVEVKEATLKMAFGVSCKKILSYNPSEHSDSLRDSFRNFLKGMVSIPLYIPGTIFYKSLEDKRKGIRMLKDMVKERLKSDKKHRDFLDLVIEDMKREESIFDLENAADVLFMVLFASSESLSLAITFAINFITEHPSVLKDLTEEHEGILRNKGNDANTLTWNDYKSMEFTSHVIDETLRLANVAPALFRRAIKDIKIGGYTIPAGWGIMMSPPALHLNPEKYEDPLIFNPWRWKGQGSNQTSKSFIPFGWGMRVCAGAEYTKMQMAVVIHFLVTNYRWTKIKGGEITRNPATTFPNGLHIKVIKKQ